MGPMHQLFQIRHLLGKASPKINQLEAGIYLSEAKELKKNADYARLEYIFNHQG
jgi:hypothetical protein